MKRDVDVNRIMSEGKLVDRALRAGVRQALLRHEQLGVPIVVWRDGRVVVVQPDQIRGILARSRTRKGRRSRRPLRASSRRR